MQYRNVYFIGIGGIGMSALARYFKFKGLGVGGYDRTPTALTHSLESEGILVHYTADLSAIPDDREHTLIVYTPAIPEDFQEMTYVREKGYNIVKRAAALGVLTQGYRCLAVSGTHGKTTTSTLAAHILKAAGVDTSAFLGGISKNYSTNLLLGEGDTVVVEADEFDRSFHQLHPEIAVVTAMDADHLDIYGTLENYQEAFRIFVGQVSGHVVAKKGLPLTEKDTPAHLHTYSFEDQTAEFHPEGAHPDKLGYYHYDLVHPGGIIRNITVGVPGRLNAENSLAAAAMCLLWGLAPEKVKAGIASFKGVERRLDAHVNTEGISYIDDYAHHPEELSSAIHSLRDMFPGRRITGIFQPHLFSRTNDFHAEFAKALSQLDKLILLDIYPARELPIPGVTSEIIFKDVTAPEKVLLRKEELLDYLEKEDIDVLVTFGAGNISDYIAPITSMLEGRLEKA